MPIACITGATSGIGRAAVERFVREGWLVVAIGRREERLCELKAEFPGGVIETLALDVRDRDQVLAALGALEERYSEADSEPLVVLVNSAGLALGLEPAQDCSLEDWETMVDTNIKGLMCCTKALLPGMIRRGFGHIVNIGSIAGTYAYPGGNVYGASKSFVLQFSRGLRCDLHGTGVRVTNIEPGLLETEFSSVRFKGDEERAAAVYRGTKPLEASDIADIIWWVVSTPAHVDITQVEVMPTTQSLGGTRVFKTES